MTPENVIIEGDCLDAMATWDAESVDAICTDPPYGIGFLDLGWDHGVPGVPFWAEMLRVAKPGAHLLSFGSTRTVHRITVAIEDAGWEIRDTLVWAYAEGMPKDGDIALDIDRRECAEPTGHRRPGQLIRPGEHECARSAEGDPWRDWSTALKPSWEPIVLARKPMPTSAVTHVLAYGTGVLNIGATRIPVDPADPVNDREWVSQPSATRPGTAGFITSTQPGDRRATKPQGGRWTPNLVLTDPIFDGGMEGVEGGGETASGVLEARPKHGSYSGRFDASTTMTYGDVGSYSRFFVIPKADRADREPLLGEMPERDLVTHGVREQGPLPKQTPQGPVRRANHHPTVKPTDLIRHLVRLVTPPGGLVLDPFGGSGTMAVAAEKEGFRWLLIEKEAEYVAVARARLLWLQRGMGL